jgi:signal transduction histidine kinase
MAIIFSVTALFATMMMARQISKPILQLDRVTRQISEGDKNAIAILNTEDEIDSLARSFNRMTGALYKAQDELEIRVEERTHELAKSNRKLREEIVIRENVEKQQINLLEQIRSANEELKNFAYVVSHDLKAPLRAIGSLTDWILQDYNDKLDEDGKEQLALLKSRVERMHNLINGILQYSRVGRIKEEKIEVDLQELVPDIINTLDPPEHIKVTVEENMPSIVFEKTRIEQVFQNLINNAVKYMDKPDGEVHVDCKEDHDQWQFSVSDNGPGIDEKYHGKIFQIFQTLASRDEVESTGVGLSVVKKIIETNGGKIWVESKVGSGSKFIFLLPRSGSNA